MQEEFVPVVEMLESECKAYFGERICTAYLHGSIDKQDAVYGISDLDYYLILHDAIAPADIAWSQNTAKKLENQFCAVDEVHLSIQWIEGLRDDPFTRFILSHNATLRIGMPIEAVQESRGYVSFSPDKQLAKMRLGFARRCFSDAIQNRQSACTGDLPSNPYYASRKLVRYFIVVEGAYFLMSRNKFSGFDKACVIADLKAEAPAFCCVLDMAESVLVDPVNANIEPAKFLEEVRPLVEWMFEEIDRS